MYVCMYVRYRVIFSKLLSKPVCASQVELHWASPHLLWGMQRICGPFYQDLCVSGDFVSQHVFLLLDLQPKTPTRSATNFADLLFLRLSLCLSRDSLFCDTHSLDLCILSKFIFLYLWYIPPRSCAFHTLYFTPNFSYVYFRAKYFYPWWRCSSELNYYFKFQQSKASFELYFSFWRF